MVKYATIITKYALPGMHISSVALLNIFLFSILLEFVSQRLFNIRELYTRMMRN